MKLRALAIVGAVAAAVGALGAHAVFAQPVVPPTATPITGTDTIVKLLARRSFRFTVHDTGFEAYGTSTWDPLQRIVYGDIVWGPYYKGPWKKEWRVTDSHSCFRDLGAERWDCYRIFVEGANHYEVRDDGVVHSLHVPLAD